MSDNLKTVNQDLRTAGELRRTADYIHRHGWLQGGLGYHGASRCVVGAMLSSVPELRDGDADWTTERIQSLAESMELSWAGSSGAVVISVWNDEADRTAEEVIDRLESTALALEVRALRDNAQELAAERLELVAVKEGASA